MQQVIVYSFWRNPMIHESAAATISLHRTKVGAWRAKNRFMNDLVMQERDFAIQHGGRWMMRHKPLDMQAFGIEEIEVQE